MHLRKIRNIRLCRQEILLSAAAVSKERIGFGDGVLFLAVGVWCGLWGSVSLLFLSLIYFLIVGAVGILFFRRSKKEAFPFVPFVLAAALTGILTGGFG